MISRFMLIIGVLSVTWTAQAQVANCVKSMSLAPNSTGVNVFSSGSGSCINDTSVTASAYPAVDANAFHALLNQKCQAIAYNAGCLPKPPPVYYKYSYSIQRAKLLSASGNKMVSIQLQTSVLEPMACQTNYTNHSVVLDISNSANAPFLKAASSLTGKYVTLYLQCTDPVVSNTSGNITSKIYSGCKVQTYSPTSAPYSSISCY